MARHTCTIFIRNTLYHCSIGCYFVQVTFSKNCETQIFSYFTQSLHALRMHISEIAMKEPYMGERIPIRWLQLESSLLQMAANKMHYISLQQVSSVQRHKCDQGEWKLPCVIWLKSSESIHHVHWRPKMVSWTSLNLIQIACLTSLKLVQVGAIWTWFKVVQMGAILTSLDLVQIAPTWTSFETSQACAWLA